MKVLVDTDVLLDVALRRPPFFQDAKALLDLLEAQPGTGCIAWHSASNFYCLVDGSADLDPRVFLAELTRFVEVAAAGTEHLRYAARLPMKDFEDAMQAAAAQACGAEIIATRNTRDYRNSPVAAAKPSKVVRLLLKARGSPR